jgi:hypothetical protein
MTRAILLAAVAMAILQTVACSPPQEPGIKVIVGARLITAPGRAPIEYSVVVIDGSGKVLAAGPQSSTPVPKGAEMTRGLGMTIEPAPGAGPIEPGQPANLVLKAVPGTDSTGKPPAERAMRNGQWVQ